MPLTPRPLRAALTVAALLLAHGTATAQPAAATVTRADLAWRYLLMDATYAASDSAGRIADSTRAAVNRMFDRSTLSFLGGQFALTAAMMDSAITMADPSYRSVPRALPAGVMSDVVAPGTGLTPATRPVGDRWRSYRGANGAEIPMRVIAPKGATSRAMGVLIALRGAGGDENMFADGYGQGIATPTGRYEERLNEGHTLMVRGGVIRGIAWMLEQPPRR